MFAPFPRPPCAPWHGKISHSPEPTAPKVGGVPQSQHFYQPHLANHAKLAGKSETFKTGLMALTYIRQRIARSTIRVAGGVGRDLAIGTCGIEWPRWRRVLRGSGIWRGGRRRRISPQSHRG